MILTFVIEISLAIYTILRYKMNEISLVILSLLVSLGLFQYSEYNVCTTGGELWSRIGYVAITALPPLGIHLFYLLSGKVSRKVVVFGYVTMALFAAYFLTASNVFNSYQCTGNYVIFQLSDIASRLYGLYYYGLLVVGIFLGADWLINNPKPKAKRKLIEALIIGYLVFLVPTVTVTTFFPDTRAAIPSIMCGFAIVFALILALYIAPKSLKIKK